MSTPEPTRPEQMRPEQMREAVARYVEEIHRAYVAQAMTFPAAVRGRMPLLAPGPLTVAAVGARNLHLPLRRMIRFCEAELPLWDPGLIRRKLNLSPDVPTKRGGT